jgi:hypothetical protein
MVAPIVHTLLAIFCNVFGYFGQQLVVSFAEMEKLNIFYLLNT